MTDTAFHVPAAKLSRFTSMYAPADAGLTGILLTQRMMTSPEPPEVARDFWSRAYAALA